MNSVMTISTQTKRLVGVAALAATLFTTTGTLALAQHYARHDGRGEMNAATAAECTTPAASRHAEAARPATQS